MTPEGYALALGLLEREDLAPLPVRAGWASFLRRHEPHPADLREAVRKAHERGHMHAGRLTPRGVLAALQALGVGMTPPSLYAAPTVGQVVNDA